MFAVCVCFSGERATFVAIRGAAGQSDENVTKSKSFVAIRREADEEQRVNQLKM